MTSLYMCANEIGCRVISNIASLILLKTEDKTE